MSRFAAASPVQPVTGRLPTMWEVGPSDLRYSSGTAPAFQGRIDRMYGRHLAGAEADVQDESSQPAWSSNELDYYAEMDDVQGNGVFDPAGSHGNIHPDAGIFAAHFSIPGYMARDRMYSKSEVIDSTTGRPVVYVNGGAVALDDSARIAFIENNQYQQPKPILNLTESGRMRPISTVNVRQNPAPIGPSADPAAVSGTPMSGAQLFALTAAIGLAAGIAYAAFRKKK